jgi:hypothetical protein
MFSKEESARLRKEFWISFGKSFPRKWLLYNTKIKDLSLKFEADRKKAMVCIDISMKDFELRQSYFEQFLSLKSLFLEEIPELVFDNSYYLESGKEISRIYVQLDKVSIHNKDSWQNIYTFFVANMNKLEKLFLEYQDFIKSAVY